MSGRARGSIWRAVVSLVTFAIVLTGTIAAVGRLSGSDQITLSGGIAIFATVLTAWIVGVGALWTHWWRRFRAENADTGGPIRRTEAS